MSDAHNRRMERRRRWQRRQLFNLFQQGGVLVASADIPGRLDVRRIVSVSRAPDGTARVHVKHYHPHVWDDTFDESERYFLQFDEALNWLETEFGVPWDQLQEPG